MDVLSDAVTALRTGRPHSARVHFPAPFGRQFPPFEGAGFHLVLQGSCWLFPAQGTPIALGVGDVAFLPHGAMHALADTRLPPAADATVMLCVPALDSRSHRSAPYVVDICIVRG